MRTHAEKTPLTTRLFPFLSWFSGYQGADLKADLVAGMTVAVVLIPQSMAYALLAGLPPVYGLYAAAVTPVIAALWGSLRQLATGPIAIMSLLVLTTLSPLAEPGSEAFIRMAFLLSFMVGGIYLLIGVFRMGVIMSFISHSAVKGFTSAAALIIISTQLPHLLGVKVERTEYMFHKLVNIAKALPDTHWPTLAVGLAAMAIIYGLKKWKATFPGALVALASVTVAVVAFELHHKGIAIIGQSDSGLPGFALPLFDFDTMSQLVGPAVVLALVSFAETYSVGKSISAETKQKLDVDQEFIGQGMANVAGAFFQCYPVSGSFSRSAINYATGARTGISSAVTSFGVVVALLYLTPYLTYIPKAALAALVINAVLMLFHPREVFRLWKMNRDDGLVAVTVFVLSLLAKPDEALLLGVMMSLMFFLWKTMHPRIVRISKVPELGVFVNADLSGQPSCPQIIQLRSDNVIYFANAEYTIEHILERVDEHDTPVKFLLLDLQAMAFIDITGVDELRVLKEELEARGIRLAMMEIRGPVRKVLDSAGFTEEMDARYMLNKRGDAYVVLFADIDHDYCRSTCPYALFNECLTIKSCPPEQTRCKR